MSTTAATITILERGPDWIAVAKPSGLAIIPGRVESTSLLHVAAAQLGVPATGTADPRLRVVHRLDKDTSGVVVFALSAEAQRRLCGDFLHHRAVKEYLALVHGRPDADTGTIDAPIAPHDRHPERMIVTRTGKPCLTDWRVESRFRQFTLLRCFPRTGRTHQIRVHLQHAGLPIVLDPVYGPRPTTARGEPPARSAPPPALLLSSFKRGYRPTGTEERPLLTRLALHAHRLTLPSLHGDPSDLTPPTTLEAPLPKDLATTIKQLEKFGR